MCLGLAGGNGLGGGFGEVEDFSALGRGELLGLAFEQERAELPFRITGKPRLIRQQLDPAVTGLGIHRADVFAFLTSNRPTR